MKPNRLTTSKYTAYTFLPLNLYYQFTKYNNLFFLITLILLCIPSISPFTPYTYLFAFSLIIGISMIKDALEDKKRHEQDRKINMKNAYIIKNNAIENMFIEDIQYGDYVMVNINEEVPADMILVNSMGHGGCRKFCFVETSNLDGENNLKRKTKMLDVCTRTCNTMHTQNAHRGRINTSDLCVDNNNATTDSLSLEYANNDFNSRNNKNINSRSREKICNAEGKKNTEQAYRYNQDKNTGDYNNFNQGNKIDYRNDTERNNPHQCSAANGINSKRRDNNGINSNEIAGNDINNNEITGNDINNNKITGNDINNNQYRDNEITSNEITGNKSRGNEFRDNEITGNEFRDNEIRDNEFGDNEISDNKFRDNEHVNTTLNEDITPNEITTLNESINPNENINNLQTSGDVFNDSKSPIQPNLNISPASVDIIHSLNECDKKFIHQIKSFSVRETTELLNDVQCVINTSYENLYQSDKNVLLKGSILKNTEYVVGLVIGVGVNTKQCKNLTTKELRISLFERKVNKILCIIFIGYFFVLFFTSMMASLFLNRSDIGYLFLSNNKSVESLQLVGTNYILFSYLIPISLFVTLEVARIFSALFIANDDKMKMMDNGSVCRNSNVVEDLGIIEHILTDKTGTLTKNDMCLKYVHLKDNDHLVDMQNGTINMKDHNDGESNTVENQDNNDAHKNTMRGNNKLRSADQNKIENDTNLISKDHKYASKNNQKCKSMNNNEKHEHVNNKQENDHLKNDYKLHENDVEKNANILSINDNEKLENGSSPENKSVLKKGTNPDYDANMLSTNYDHNTMFILSLLLCNSVENFNGKYEGPSNDEICILEGIKKYGMLIRRTDTHIDIQLNNKKVTIPTLLVLNFTSKRQRMSVIVKIQNKSFLIVKGSDLKVLPLILDNKDLRRIIDRNSYHRSLVLAFKALDNVDSILREYEEIGLENRGNKMDSLFEAIEKDLNYLGTTFVEDSLQDGVKQCISGFKKAGIKVWMVTGDKKETALSCGKMCGLKEGRPRNNQNNTSHNMNSRQDNNRSSNFFRRQADATGNNSGYHQESNQQDNHQEDHQDNQQEDHQDNQQENHQDNQQENHQDNQQENHQDNQQEDRRHLTHNTRLISALNNSVNSFSSKLIKYITNILAAKRNKPYSAECEIISASDIIKRMESGETFNNNAIIYRASPEEKAKIARLLVNSNVNVLAIGDGNNDVMMLREANVGVGIAGSEGTQAALSSDISVPTFLCLSRLLFVHGRYSYLRFSKLTLNSIYKNLLLITVQVLYNFYNGFSGRPVFNFFFLNYFNILFTSFLPLYISIFDKDVKEERLLEEPERYKNTNRYFDMKTVTMNISLAFFKALLIFWLTYFIFNTKDITKGNGLIGGYSAMNNYFSLLVFATVFTRQIRMIGFYNIFSYFFMAVTLFLYFVVIFGVQELSSTTKNTAYHLYSMPVFYLSFMTVFGIILMIDFIYDTQHKKI